MELSVVSWNVRGENTRTRDYLEHALNWVKTNWNGGRDVDFILMQETSIAQEGDSMYYNLLTSLGYQVFKCRERDSGRGDCYLFGISNEWTIGEGGQYIKVWDPNEISGCPIRSPYILPVSKDGIGVLLVDFHNAFGVKSVRYACAEALAAYLNALRSQGNICPTIIAGDFNLCSDELPDYSPFSVIVNNRYDHIITSPELGCICGEPLDEDEDGLPEIWLYEDGSWASTNGSDHCMLAAKYNLNV